MGINVIVDEKLVEEARRLTGLPTASEAIEQIIRSASARPRRPIDGMLDLAGTEPLREDYDHKALRAGGQDDARD